jgi:MFS family permease
LTHGHASSEWRQNGHLVALTAIGLTFAPTTLPVYTMGVFVGPFEQAFGWGRGAIQTAMLFSTGLAVFCAPVAGDMIRRWGIRSTILPGIVGLSLACLLGAMMGGALWQLYAVYALMSLLGAGAGVVGWTSLIAGRFDKARGLALGIGLSGTGLCSVMMPQIAAAAMADWGWRGAYVALAFYGVIIVLPLSFLLLPRDRTQTAQAARRDTAKPAPLAGMDLAEAVRSRRFWLLGFSTLCIFTVIGGIIPNLVPAFTDDGLSMQQAASIMSIFGMATIGGRIAVGALVDRVWAPAVAAVVMVPAALGCVLIAVGSSFAGYVTAAVLLGIATGTELDVLGFLVARYFGIADYARIYSRAYAFVAASAGVSPLIFGHLFDITGSYRLALLISAGLLVIGGSSLLLLGRYPDWRREANSSAA